MPAAGAHGKFTMMFASPFGEGKVDRGVGHRHADPPSSNSPNGSECDCVGGLVGHQLGARLPDAADSFDRWFPAWRRSGFDLQTCWPSVIGALWSANRRRESGRRQQQYRHRVRRSCSARWIHAARCDSGQLMEHGALQQSQILPLQTIDFIGQKEGVRGLAATLIPNGIFIRCTGVYLARVSFASSKVTTAIRAKFLLTRFALNATSACLAAKRLKSIGNGATSSTLKGRPRRAWRKLLWLARDCERIIRPEIGHSHMTHLFQVAPPFCSAATGLTDRVVRFV